MANGMMKFMKGMSLGVIVGCVAGAVGNQYMHTGKKGLMSKAMKNVSELFDEMGNMF